MKFGTIFVFFLIVLLVADFSSALWRRRGRRRRRRGRRNVHVGIKNGITHTSNNGRHTTNVGYTGIKYGYRGNRWNTQAQHNFFNGQTNIQANRGRHSLGFGHNWRNRQTTFGYRFNFGKRRRSIELQDEPLETLKIERKPNVFQKKLQLAVNQFIKSYKDVIPYLTNLSVSDPKGKITNATVAQEIVCVVKKLQKILPEILRNFITKMINYHGGSFDVDDFFSVGSQQAGQQNVCEVPDVPAGKEVKDPPTLMKIKQFITSLIVVAMEYEQMLNKLV